MCLLWTSKPASHSPKWDIAGDLKFLFLSVLCCWLTNWLNKTFLFFFFFFGCSGSLLLCVGLVACGILVPQPGIEPTSPALEGRFSTIGPPGKSVNKTFLSSLFRGSLFFRIRLVSLCYSFYFLKTCFLNVRPGLRKKGEKHPFLTTWVPESWHPSEAWCLKAAQESSQSKGGCAVRHRGDGNGPLGETGFLLNLLLPYLMS